MDGLQDYCRICSHTANQKYRVRNHDQIRKRSIEYYYKNRAVSAVRSRKVRIEFRRKVLESLSKANNQPQISCSKCGFSDIRALEIDHVNSDGHKDKKLFNGYSSRYYSRFLNLPHEEIRGKYQILCSNCNMIKMSENGEYRKNGKSVCCG